MIEGIISIDEISLTPNLDILSNSIPWVLCGEKSEHEHFSSVCIDDEEATYFIVKKLIETGKKKIALINHDTKLSYAKKRQLGFERASSEGNINPNNIVYVKAHSFHDGAEALAEICSKPSMPDAIIAASDILAVGAMHQAKKMGINIPEELSIIGFDNIPIAKMLSPQLSTIHQPTEKIGEIALKILDDKINFPEKPSQAVILEWQFMERGTN
ncbi:substrate-binding domain-containing protein [Salmonella enterica]|nr:substrate-binding domain-containing protein [Salmonella enterica]EHU5061722.1 substrate-binding domain-containing protein [Salmonella enterica]EIN1164825.1 substrate-binding domain-containing protein [Salmonella enterica]